MSKKLLSLALAAILLAALIPTALADSERTMYVYTENGKSLNVRSAPVVADNIIGTLAFGYPVTVTAVSANGWSTILWQNYYGEFFSAYVQSRFLVNYKPSAVPKSASTAAPAAAPATDAAKALSDMNREFTTAKKVSPYTVTARPSRASGWVNMRWAPSTEAERIANLPSGQGADCAG